MAPLVRTGGSRHTGLAALPHRNIQLAKMSRVFKVSIEYILRNELNEKEEDVKSEIMRLYRSLDRYNRETWVILGKRLLGGQIQDYTEIIEKS